MRSWPGLSGGFALVACSAVCGALQGPAGDAAPAAPTRKPPRELVVAWLRGARDRLAADLERTHAELLGRARTEDPALAERLSPEPPKPRPSGYKILPEIAPDPEPQKIALRETQYSIEVLTTAYTRDFLDASVLAARATDERTLELAPAVSEFERLRARMRNLEDHLSYHDWWQGAISSSRVYFDGRNGVIAKVREMQALRLKADAASIERAELLNREVRREVAPFTATPGLAVQTADGGVRTLVVHVLTDIEDPAFLEAVRQAIELHWNASAAAREQRFALVLELEVRWAEELYPQGAPERGTPLDLADHVGRFPAGALVLTTGAGSTHSWVGRSILLGASPITPRTLAHEFGHLLGFSDGYLRGYAGEPEGPFGVTVLEWTGLFDDLMGSPGAGVVTPEMVDELLAAYG